MELQMQKKLFEQVCLNGMHEYINNNISTCLTASFQDNLGKPVPDR